MSMRSSRGRPLVRCAVSEAAPSVPCGVFTMAPVPLRFCSASESNSLTRGDLMSQHVDELPEDLDGPANEPGSAQPKRTESVFSGPYRALSLGVILSVGMVAFESLGVATVLPDIARDLDGLGAYGWGLSALMLANIIGTVLAGRTADLRGPWAPAAVGMAVFAAGCALA